MDVGGGDIGALQLNAAQNDGEQPENVNISDVLEAITIADPLYGGGVESMARPPARQPTVEIEEQPASKALRFRYECEGRSAGSIPGARSTSENKTYPTLRVKDYVGPCTIVASCVTKDEPYRPHPHNLVGRERCDRGVCTLRATITEENPLVQFRNLGIQCVKKKDVEAALQQRAQLRVDPCRTGFDPRTYPSIELNSVRLAFQVFLPDSAGQMRMPLRAVVSDVIHDKKAMGELCILRASHCSGSARGGTQLVLLTEKVSREEVTVMFFDKSGWKAPANLILVHKQVAIVIETPPYRDGSTTDHVNVEYRLQRGSSASEDDQSKPFPFEYIPEYSGLPFQPDQQIKIEPNRSPPTHQVMSPPHQQLYSPVSPYGEQQQRWIPEQMNVAGANLNPFGQPAWQFQQSLAPSPQYAQSPSPMHMQTLSPMGQASPVGHISPGLNTQMATQMGPSPGLQMGHLSPMQGALSPGLGGQMGQSPGLGGQMGQSPGLGSQMGQSPGLGGQIGQSPGLGGQQIGQSPGLQHMPLGHVSPMHGAPMGHISPGLQQQQQQQQQPSYQQMDSGTPSFSGLLNEGLPQLGLVSGDFSLPSMGEPHQLSDSLTRLSTSDLQQLQF